MNAYPELDTPLTHYRLLGSSGLRVSPLCLGTMTFGTQWADFVGECSKATAREIFMAFIEAGGNFIDTANKYQEGEAEEWIGEFIQECEAEREDLVIATKYSLPIPRGAPNRAGNHRKNLVQSVKESLRRLRTDYIDLLYVHYYDNTVSADELMRSLNYLCASGQVLHVAISDAPAWFAAECNTVARLRNTAPFVAYQGRYNAADRDVEADVLPMCRAMKMGFVPWSVLAAGRLATETRAESSRGSGELDEVQQAVHEAIVRVAGEIGKSVAQVAISWVAMNAQIPSVMVGARKLRHIQDAIAALSFRLSNQHYALIAAAGETLLPFPHRFLEGVHFTEISWTKPSGRIVDHFDAPVQKSNNNKKESKKSKKK